MELEPQKTSPILDIAWTRQAHLDSTAGRRTKAFYNIRKWIMWLGVLATFLALITQLYFSDETTLPGLIAKILLVATPVVASILAAFSTKFYANGHWLVYRAGAEEILKEIYFYRTILQNKRGRRAHLEKRLGEIQRQLYRSLGGEFAFENYNGPIPPHYNPQNPASDPGYHDLTGAEYFKFRLEDQLAWHNKKVNQYKWERRRLTILILAAGGLGAVFAAWGGGFSVWVALTASITAALIGWQELRNLDSTVKNYSKVVMELTILYDHWHNLEPEERTPAEFYKMVRDCEDVLWSQNMEYIRSMQEALQDAGVEKEADMINRIIRESMDSAERTKQAMAESIIDQTRTTLEDTEEKITETFNAALGSLAEEAASDLVREELEAMSKAVQNTAAAAKAQAASLSSRLAHLYREYGKELSRDTTKEELNAFLARLPKTDDVKG